MVADTLPAMFIEPTNENGRRFVMRGISGSVTMLNLLRFREEADYSAAPELAPDAPITGRRAYEIYAKHTLPFLAAEGGEVTFTGEGGHFLIGPEDGQWDMVMLVRYPSVEAFMAMTSNRAYLAGIGHRVAALADSRLLPIED